MQNQEYGSDMTPRLYCIFRMSHFKMEKTCYGYMYTICVGFCMLHILFCMGMLRPLIVE